MASLILTSGFIPREPEEITAEWLFEVINQVTYISLFYIEAINIIRWLTLNCLRHNRTLAVPKYCLPDFENFLKNNLAANFLQVQNLG